MSAANGTVNRPLTDAAPTNRTLRVALLGNPNTGKTTLFNRLTGLRHKTANFPGTTLDARLGRFRFDGAPAVANGARADCCGQEGATSAASASPPAPGEVEVIDLPGIYSLELAMAESEVCREALAGRAGPHIGGEVDALCVVVDATNLSRNLRLVGEALRRRLPTLVAVNMIDLARKRGLKLDLRILEERLGCAVVVCSARTGEGIDALKSALLVARIPTRTAPGTDEGLIAWADEAFAACASGGDDGGSAEAMVDRLDRAFTHPVLGVFCFVLVMTALFYSIFSLAHLPMDAIDWFFSSLGDWVQSVMPEGVLREFLSKGVIAGIGATVIFVPQICLLFFLISLLEDTGYLARAALLMDRVLRPFGIPGHAFLPLLSSHACALPGIMACRAVPDPKERLATILVAPFMTCSARLPVYVLLTSLLFPTKPLLAALAFVGCYTLGVLAGVLSALVARRTILRGKSRPMALELPSYKWPSFRTAAATTLERAWVFVKNAGTNILAICVILWWLGAFPRVDPPATSVQLRQQAAVIEQSAIAAAANKPSNTAMTAEIKQVADLNDQADRLERSNAKVHSFMGRMGRFVQPVFEPLGYDWQLTVGVLASFAAREVFVSTMAVVTTGEEDDKGEGVLDRLAQTTRSDGKTPIFTTPTAWSLLVYYVLAMQCLPTLAVTAKESGSVKWAALQLVWMSGLAYLAAMLVYRLAGGT